MQYEIEKHLQNLDWNRSPIELYEPIGYALESGGKRVRPQLVLMACQLFDNEPTKAISAALAVEIFHNFTLLHDDIMDHADVRRGRPTVHRKWDENTAILSGDAMMIAAYEQLAKLPSEKLAAILPLFNKTALEVCEGQQYDINFEKGADVALNDYIEMIRLKTAVLLACALKMGAIVGGASQTDAQALYDFGINIGLAFQLRDDFLDTFGDQATFGKRIGGDILCDKKTFLRIKAEELANAHQLETLHQIEWPSDEAKIAAVTQVYRELNVDKLCEDEIVRYQQLSFAALAAVSGNILPKTDLQQLAEKLTKRVS